MKGAKWQFSLYTLAIAAIFVLIVDAAILDVEKRHTKEPITTTTHSTHHHKHHGHKHHHRHSSSLPAQATKTIRNCSLASIQRKNLLRSKSLSRKPPHTNTIYVCHRSKHSTKKHATSTKKHTTHKKHLSTHKKHSTSTKKHTTTTHKKHTTSTHKKHTTSTKKHSSHKKHTTSSKKTQKKKTTSTTTTKAKAKNIATTKETHKSGTTSTAPIVAAALPTSETTYTSDNNSTDDNNDNNDSYSDDRDNNDDGDDSSVDGDEDTTATTPTTDAPVAAAAAGTGTGPAASVTPDDNNNQVSVQSISNGQEINSEPQSKVIGVSIGAVVGCLAAAGLAGMFIYKHKQNNKHDQDVEDMTQNSEVNTRWRTQSFMAVVAGAVAKLPKRSNSSSSTRSGGVLGSIRRAASNASSKLSRSGSRSSTQSYGIAVSGPIPAIQRIDGDQATYYAEPISPSSANHHHTHAY